MNFKILSNKTILFLIIVCLTCIIFFGFSIRLLIPVDCHFIMSVIVVILYIFFLILSFSSGNNIGVENALKRILISGFISINTWFLYSISSINRENEIRNYVDKNEDKLKNLVDYLVVHGKDQRFFEFKNEMNIRNVFIDPDECHINLYGFMGYGYGIIYTTQKDLKKPEKTSSFGSPIVKWFAIKDNWYYYSYFD